MAVCGHGFFARSRFGVVNGNNPGEHGRVIDTGIKDSKSPLVSGLDDFPSLCPYVFRGLAKKDFCKCARLP